MRLTPTDRLEAAWAELERRGAVVHRVELQWLARGEVASLAEYAEWRLRVLAEGREAGWFPLEAS